MRVLSLGFRSLELKFAEERVVYQQFLACSFLGGEFVMWRSEIIDGLTVALALIPETIAFRWSQELIPRWDCLPR
ncbi:hypothetical protein AY488_09845 [Corynebacterium belfantii]|nr:hypothetical protein AY488_09845 [Corynebacterium belfantii]